MMIKFRSTFIDSAYAAEFRGGKSKSESIWFNNLHAENNLTGRTRSAFVAYAEGNAAGQIILSLKRAAVRSRSPPRSCPEKFRPRRLDDMSPALGLQI